MGGEKKKQRGNIKWLDETDSLLEAVEPRVRACAALAAALAVALPRLAKLCVCARGHVLYVRQDWALLKSEVDERDQMATNFKERLARVCNAVNAAQ
jgi:hypothetical protein